MIQLPGIELDFDHSMIKIHETRFPACVANIKRCTTSHDVCEGCVNRGACLVAGPEHTNDPGWDKGWSVLIPLENGTLMNVIIEADTQERLTHGALQAVLRPRTQYCDPFDNGSWLIGFLDICGREIHHHPNADRSGIHRRGQWNWDNCEPEWLAEHIQRVARLPITTAVPGQTIELLALYDSRVRPIIVPS